MIRTLTFVVYCLTFSFACAQGSEKPDGRYLKPVENRIQRALHDVDGLTFEYPKSYPGTLIVNYGTRTFMVYGQSRGGQYSKKPHETVGPSYRGFQLRLTVQNAGTTNSAVVPQTLRRPYWRTDLDIRLLEGTGKQVYCGLSCGSRVEKNLLQRVRKAVADLGGAPYLKREPKTTKKCP